MKTKGLAFMEFFKIGKKRDLFESTQFRLTLLYSGLLMLFLIVFIIVVYSILYATIFKDQERELEKSVSQEAKNVEDYIRNQEHRGLEFRNQESVERDVDQFFYYVVNRSGELVLGDEMIPDLRSELLTMIKGWNPTRDDIRLETFKVTFSERGFRDKGRKGDDFRPAQRTDTIRLISAGHPISYNGENVGMLYIGKEVSFAYQLFKWLLIILIGLAVLFSGVALVISFYMSKKAMVPISQAFSRQREFVADASHELRTPLSVMLSSIDAMEMTLDLKEEDYSHKLLFNMRNEVKRMTGLVGDLLTLARSDSGTVEHVNERFDFCAISEKAIDAVHALAQSKEIVLEFEAPHSIMVNGDSQRLTQLLYILLDNAIKYTPNGGAAVLSLAVKAKDLHIIMKDSGIGISPKEQHQIFERFYRADQSRTRQAGGHGLGLAIAKWIVESHKGTIQVASELGEGSTFFIRIPIVEQ